MKIAFYVSGNASRLRKILNQNIQKIIQATVFVFSDDKKNMDLKSICSEKNIDYFCHDYDILKKEDNFNKFSLSNLFYNYLEKYKIDYVFCFGDHILRGDIVRAYKNRIINFHPSVLPLYKGRMAIDQAIENHSFLLGNTAHFIDDKMDNGPIIMQSIMSSRLFNGDYEIVLEKQLIMIEKIFDYLIDNKINVDQNGKVIISGADYSEFILFPK